MSKYFHINNAEADALVTAAAAKGGLPGINQSNRHIFGLDKRQRQTRGAGWAAWWSMDKVAGGTGGISHHTTRFHIATEALAPDGEWPTHWDLSVLMSTNAGHELENLAYARKFDEERIGKGFDLLMAVTGATRPVSICCHCCNKVKEHKAATNLINSRHSPHRCFAQDSSSQQKACATISEKTRLRYVDALALLGHEIIGEWRGTKKKTEIRCGRCGDVHHQLPFNLLKYGPSCQSSWHQKMANGANDDGSIGRLGGLATGPINGTPTDAPWRVLTGQQERDNRATFIYLYQTAQAEVRNFGIAYDVDKRARGHHPDNVVALLGKREYPDRDTAVLIEGAFKFQFASPEVPPGLEGCGNTTEYTYVDDRGFWHLVQQLEESLQELGPLGFVEEHCSPLQLNKALEIGVLPQFIQEAA